MKKKRKKVQSAVTRRVMGQIVIDEFSDVLIRRRAFEHKPVGVRIWRSETSGEARAAPGYVCAQQRVKPCVGQGGGANGGDVEAAGGYVEMQPECVEGCDAVASRACLAERRNRQIYLMKAV